MSSAQISYKIAMPKPATHRYQVTISVRGVTGPLRFRMPAWTPGSYLIREFSRHVEDVSAKTPSGATLAVRKTDKACWLAEAPAEGLDLHYEVYAHDLTVRTSHLDSSHGFFNGGNVFFRVDGHDQGPFRLEVDVPDGWKSSVALPRGDDGSYTVANFDELVDSPVECGTHEEVHFEAGGIPHRYVFWGTGHEDFETIIADTTRLIETEIELFGGAPPELDEYLFICHMQEKWNGGLEHEKSQVLGVDRLCFRDLKGYERYTTLVAHEYFHTWNVKRIRAEGLGPFDYDQEVYTPLLWMMEGITSYYDTLIPTRAGLIKPERYLEILGDRIAMLRSIPGRRMQSLEESSFDAWIKLYRRDENSVNSSVSYYLKGAMAVLLLDLHIRMESGGEQSFDDVLRALWVRQRETGQAIAPDEVNQLLSDAAGTELVTQIDAWVRSREDLPFEAMLERFGLTITGKHKDTFTRPKQSTGEPAPWMGINTKTVRGLTIVHEVRRDGPGHEADIASGDELVAIDGLRVEPGGLKKRLALLKAGQSVRLTLSRRHEMLEREMTLSARPFDGYNITLSEGLIEDQRNSIGSWLGGLPES
jgi:predicted metalloprotease with PDZ domain